MTVCTILGTRCFRLVFVIGPLFEKCCMPACGFHMFLTPGPGRRHLAQGNLEVHATVFKQRGNEAGESGCHEHRGCAHTDGKLQLRSLMRRAGYSSLAVPFSLSMCTHSETATLQHCHIHARAHQKHCQSCRKLEEGRPGPGVCACIPHTVFPTTASHAAVLRAMLVRV